MQRKPQIRYSRGFKPEAVRHKVLRAIEDEACSSIPALGYTVPYAIGNILLTAWGPVLVANDAGLKMNSRRKVRLCAR